MFRRRLVAYRGVQISHSQTLRCQAQSTDTVPAGFRIRGEMPMVASDETETEHPAVIVRNAA
jgi:hypothetical protein